ncbi:integrase, partial [Mesorhizobium sp. M4B.F.Ca.ET.089.01.1.1]
MTDPLHPSGSSLRERMIEDTRRDYIRCVKRLAAVIGRSSDTATAEDLRRFQVHQTQADMQPPGITSAVSA